MKKILFPISILLLICSCTNKNTIHYAISQDNLTEVKGYVSRGDIEIQDKNGFTPLITAAYYGHATIVKYLCDKSAKVDQRDNNGWTALIYACYYNFFDVVKILVDNHASVNIVNNKGHTALYYAEKYQYEKIIRFLKDKKAKSV